MEHYSEELLAESHRNDYIKKFIRSVRNNANTNINHLHCAKNNFPMAYKFIRRIGTVGMKYNHFGQVIPLEDAERIIDFVQTITRIACICRSVTTGNNNARYCMLLGIDPTGLVDHWPELEASLETLTREEAKTLLRNFDAKGLVHSIWTFKTPYIGAICNCDHDCLAYRLQISSDLMNVMFKAEYIAQIDFSQCVGCRNCLKACQFGAIEYSVSNGMSYINPLKCYGCGLCRSACKKEAISLIDKGPLS